MATLVSPGVSVTVINESFYIPASAPTVPLLFVATRANKTQPDGVTSAAGTTESGVVRTVTSIGQSTQLYGVPYFWSDSSGNQFNGDARCHADVKECVALHRHRRDFTKTPPHRPCGGG